MYLDEDGLGIFRVLGNLFGRIGKAIASIFSGETCSCKNNDSESFADSWNTMDFPVINDWFNDLFGGSGGGKVSTSSPNGNIRSDAVIGINNLNPAVITMNQNINISTPNFNILTTGASTQSQGPTPIPIIGKSKRVSFNRNIEFGNSSSKLNTHHTEKTLRDLIKTLVDYPQLIVSISTSVSVTSNQGITSNTGVSVDGKNGTVGGLLSARAKAIQRFLIRRGVDPSQILIGNGKIKSNGSRPDATFSLINPNK